MPNRHSFCEAIQVARSDLGLGAPSRRGAIQRRAADRVHDLIVVGAGSLVTGLAIYKPVQFAWLPGLLGRRRVGAVGAFCLAAGYVLFFVVHVVQVVRRAGTTFAEWSPGTKSLACEATLFMAFEPGQNRKDTAS